MREMVNADGSVAIASQKSIERRLYLALQGNFRKRLASVDVSSSFCA